MYRRLVTPVSELLNSKFVNTRPILAINQYNVTNLQTRPFSSISPIIYKLEQNLPSYEAQQITKRFYSTDIKRPDPVCTSGANCLICPTNPNDKKGMCAHEGVVYKATCPYCGAFYIGETGRALKERAAEHERDRKKVLNNEKPKKRTPFTEHRCTQSTGRDYLPLIFKLLQKDLNNKAKRQEREEHYVEKERPAINRKTNKKKNKKVIH